MKLSFAAVLELFNTMHSVCEHKDTVIAGPVRLNLSINMTRLKDSAESYVKIRRELEVNTAKVGKLSPETISAIESQMQEMALVEDEYNLKTIKLEQLDLQSNTHITPSIVAGLNAIIEDAEKPVKISESALEKLKALAAVKVVTAESTPTEA